MDSFLLLASWHIWDIDLHPDTMAIAVYTKGFVYTAMSLSCPLGDGPVDLNSKTLTDDRYKLRHHLP